jgi:histone H3/H4
MVKNMAKRGRDLPLAPFKKIIQKSGGARVSASAAAALRDEVEDVARDIAARASRLSNHAGRKTVTAQDIKLAVKA